MVREVSIEITQLRVDMKEVPEMLAERAVMSNADELQNLYVEP